jgi:hypothetical protein
MDEGHTEGGFRTTAKALAALFLIGVVSRWAPILCSLLVIAVMLHYAAYAWRTLAKIPAGQVAELLAVAAFALGTGFLAKLGVAPLIVTGLVLLVTVPLWRLARNDSRDDPR